MKLAIYDFDGTYMRAEILRTVYKFWKEEGLNKKLYKKIWHLILWRNFLHKFQLCGWTKPKFRANAMALTADLFRSVDRKDLDQFLEDLYHYLQPHINPKMKEQLKRDKEEGYYTILLSGNFNVILKPFLQEGFDEVIGSDVEKDGQIVTSDEVKIIINDIKKKTIQEKFKEADFSASKAYADSDYDLPVLELVGHPVAVNPDENLRRIAMQNKYQIIE